jgi:hypothetical protein
MAAAKGVAPVGLSDTEGGKRRKTRFLRCKVFWGLEVRRGNYCRLLRTVGAGNLRGSRAKGDSPIFAARKLGQSPGRHCRTGGVAWGWPRFGSIGYVTGAQEPNGARTLPPTDRPHTASDVREAPAQREGDSPIFRRERSGQSPVGLPKRASGRRKLCWLWLQVRQGPHGAGCQRGAARPGDRYVRGRD